MSPRLKIIPDICRFRQPDPKAHDYHWLSPYAYCGGDPINRVDPDGRDWYQTTKINFDPTVDAFEFQEVIINTPASSEAQFIEQNNDPSAQYLGNIVVVFDGSYDERLAADGTIDGEVAINAAVTVYGPRGENDVDTYIGFTMTSDFEKYGAIADGMYDVMYDKVGKSGMIPSHYAVNGRDFVPCVGGVNPNPGADSKTHKNGVFIHRTGLGGKASGRVSVGCPLILDSHWDRYENQIGQNNHVLIINRN